jgi:hypothetical protein
MDHLRTEIISLFESFFPDDLASRWSALLLHTPVRWAKIDPWKVWSVIDASCMDDWRGTFDPKTKQIIWDNRIALYRTNRAVVLACGHSKPVLHEIELESAFGANCPNAFLEGFISIIPGKLGLAINHDGEVIVLQRRT